MNNKITLKEFCVILLKKSKEQDIFSIAAQLSYYLILAFCPLLILIITSMSYVNLDMTSFLENLSAFLPINVYNFIVQSVNNTINTSSSGLLGISFLLVAWSASAGLRGIIKAVNKLYFIKENRSFIKVCFISIICTFFLGFSVIITLFFLVFWKEIENILIEVIKFEHIMTTVISSSRYIIVLSVIIILFCFLYMYLPSIKLSFRKVLPGAVVSTLGWLLSSMVYSWYVSKLSSIDLVYGSLGVIFSLVVWIYITSFVFILGIQVNSIIYKPHYKKRLNSRKIK